ncbi:hypothetical protein WAE56_08425, partial [Iodobacter sp. LRB]
GMTIYQVNKTAKAENWENNWNGGTINDSSDDLDAEHGSVSDISHAVATKWEKLSEAMPGILLILGLLGTFLGLGIALNKASSILSASSAAGMDESMSHLMEMMQGLGTKFKTSTWGIISFLTLKVWFSKNDFEEQRLRWCIRKVKGELDSKRLNETANKQNEQAQFISAIQQLGEHLSDSFQVEAIASREVLQQSKAALSAITSLLKLQLDKNETIAQHSLATRNTLQDFVVKNLENLGSMKESSSDMAKAAAKVGDSAGKLQSVISNFDDGVKDVLQTLKKDLGDTISDMSNSFSRNMGEMSGNLNQATTGIADAVNSLSNSVGETMSSVENSIGKSQKIQEKAAGEFETTSISLNENIEAMTQLVLKLQDSIKSGLKAVSDSNQKVSSLNSRYSDITEKSDVTVNKIQEFVEHLKSEKNTENAKLALSKILSAIDKLEHGVILSIKNNSNRSIPELIK